MYNRRLLDWVYFYKMYFKGQTKVNKKKQQENEACFDFVLEKAIDIGPRLFSKWSVFNVFVNVSPVSEMKT